MLPSRRPLQFYDFYFHFNLVNIINGNCSTYKISNWNSFLTTRSISTLKCSSAFWYTTSPVPHILLILRGLVRPLLCSASSMANHFNHALISLQDYHALPIHQIWSSHLQDCVNQSIFVLVFISTSEPSPVNSDYLSLHGFSKNDFLPPCQLFPILPAILSLMWKV